MRPTTSHVLALLLSGSACFVPALGDSAADSAPKIASLRGRVAEVQARNLINPPAGTQYCYHFGNNTAVDCGKMAGYTCYAASTDDCSDSQSDALEEAQLYCRYYSPPYINLWYNGADDVYCNWSYQCCGGSGNERELDSEVTSTTDDQTPTLPPDNGYFCYNVTDDKPVSCEPMLEGGSCYPPEQGYCSDTRTDAFALGQASCSSAGAPYVTLKRLDQEGCTWGFACCSVPSSSEGPPR
jgi:hypothetical protein